MSSNISGSRFNCLIVLPSCKEGVSSQSFIQCFTLTHSAFAVQIATPGGKNPEFITEDEQSRKWLNEFRTKAYAVPLSLEIIDANSSDLCEILLHFIKEKKLVCAIGMGVTALLSAKDPGTDSWGFKGYAVTGSSVMELSRWPDFTELPIIAEDALKDAGGSYSASSEPNCVHVQVDRHLVTGQNQASSFTAVQNLVLLSNQRQAKMNK
ncbi:glutamine amidotransferase-like class 1 domain-containing protein 1 isoform X2 [Hetaerina americana]|uniref:glutamine amidotransferase-like class 1 domain-containing protein 1 isoform X2 n=1 Tax=Hetaerina americana TaxID=62018 RepID=UPI003A7F222A